MGESASRALRYLVIGGAGRGLARVLARGALWGPFSRVLSRRRALELTGDDFLWSRLVGRPQIGANRRRGEEDGGPRPPDAKHIAPASFARALVAPHV